jgi:DNA replication protein DnaC
MTDLRITPSEHVADYKIEDNIALGRKQLANVPLRWRDAEITVPQVKTWVRELMDEAVRTERFKDPQVKQGPSLLFTGPIGTGKTYHAWAAVRALSLSGVRCDWRVVRMASMFRQLRPNGGTPEAEFGFFARCGLLVLDDLGATRGSAWEEETLTELIDERYEEMRPTLIITNAEEGLGSVVGKRIASRLDQMCTPIAFTGKDRRRDGSR